MNTVPDRHILFVVGMHRSGTSALCAALQACGATFGGSLLEPMQRVNERGFWESEPVVALNEALLGRAGRAWYSLSFAGCDFDNESFAEFSRTASGLLQTGFGGGPLEVVKDPRLCITLPFWLRACAGAGLRVSVCEVRRHPLAVAESLRERDGFPLGYGLRLASLYERMLRQAAPPGSFAVSYEALLDSPATVLASLTPALPLTLDAEAVARALDARLRHHAGTPPTSDNAVPCDTIGTDAFDDWLETHYPLDATVDELVEELVRRGREMTRVGDMHSSALEVIREREAEVTQARDAGVALAADRDRLGSLHDEALATIEQRDAQIAELTELYEEARGLEVQLNELGQMHSRALAVIEERDEQIREFDRRLAEIGELHSAALARLDELDRRTAGAGGLPVLGRVVRAIRDRAQR